MKIKLRSQYAGPKGTHAPDAIVDFDKVEAYRLIEGGFAEQVAEEVQPPLAVETAPETVVENALAPTGRTAVAPAQNRHRRKG